MTVSAKPHNTIGMKPITTAKTPLETIHPTMYLHNHNILQYGEGSYVIEYLVHHKTQIIKYISGSSIIEHFVHFKVQAMLYISAFVTCGLGDSISAIYMMHHLGIMREANPIARYIVLNHGFYGFLAFKIWITIVILSTPLFIQIRSKKSLKNTVNGFLITLSLGGILATYSNTMAMLYGNPPYDPYFFIAIYLLTSVVLINIGEWLDEKVNIRLENNN